MQNINLALITPNPFVSILQYQCRPAPLVRERRQHASFTHYNLWVAIVFAPLLHQKPVGGNEDHLLHTR